MPTRRGAARSFARSGQVSLNSVWADTIIDQVVEHAQDEVVPDGEAILRTLVPVDTGELRDKSYVRVRKLGKTVASIEVGSTAAHFWFVEVGTGRRGAATQNSGVDAPFPLPSGYRHGPSAGMRAQPFARPTAIRLIRKHYRLGVVR